jgi:hypothetical protein
VRRDADFGFREGNDLPFEKCMTFSCHRGTSE